MCWCPMSDIIIGLTLEISGGNIGWGIVRRKCSASPVLLLWVGKAGFGVLHSIEEFMSDTT